MKKKLHKLNEILLISIFALTALLAAVVGLKAYEIYDTNRELAKEQEEKEFAEVLARNAEAQNRVSEMQAEIQELTNNRQELERFIADIQTAGNGTAVDISVSGNSGLTQSTVSGNGGMFDGSVSGNGTVSGNVVSGNGSLSGSDIPGYGGFSVSGNSSVSSDNTVSGDLSGFLQGADGYVQPEMTLEERRQLHSSMEETWEVNQEDQICLAESKIDFSGKKIACLGDSITAASNLDAEENYEQYSYPANLKELLGAEEVYNLGIGGSSIGRYWADAFVDRYQEIPEDTDIIIVMGGTNDGFCVSDKEFGSLEERAYRTFCGDLDELMGGLREAYPDADIFFATPLPNILHDYLRSERDYLLPQKDFADVILTLAQEYDYEVIDLYNSNLLDSHDADIVTEYMPDGVHGNHEGYRILAEHLAAELVRYYEQEAASGNTISGNTISGNTISGNAIAGNTISRDLISDNTLSGNSISDSTVSPWNGKRQISGNSPEDEKERQQISDDAADVQAQKEPKAR